MGKSAFPESHELHFGWPGMHGAKWSNLAMNTCDVLVAIGSRFDDRVTGKLLRVRPGATVVHLDVDPAEISKLRGRHPGRRPAREGGRALAEEVAGTAPTARPPPPGSSSSAPGARSSRCATPERPVAQAPAVVETLSG